MNELNSNETELDKSQCDKPTKREQNYTKLLNVYKSGVQTFSNLKDVVKQFVNLIRKDSFKCLRFAISIFLLIFSVLFFLFALLQDIDVYERMFDYFINNLEIKNPNIAGRSF